jgi:phage-related minor tail protein
MDNATNAAQQAGQAFSSITRNMESAIDNFVETGKFSFKDFSRSIIQDLIKIELKAQATKVLGMLGGGGGIFSAIGSLFGFANGGTPPINRPSIVGEQGPELFMPKSAGTIIPNNKLGMGGDTQVSAPVTNNYITNNVSALDAKSVAQLFAENRKTLLGTVEMARKEMPYSNR